MIAILRRHPVLVLTLIAALVAAGVFALNLGHHARGWDRGQPEPVAGWMTVGHIARTRDLDPREIDRIAGLPLPEETGGPQTLDRIAAARGVPVETVIASVEAAIAVLSPPGPGPDPAAPAPAP